MSQLSQVTNDSVRRSDSTATETVGSDTNAAKHFADKNDFGVPAADAAKYPGLADEAKNRPEGDHEIDPRSARSGTNENRTSGVGGRSSGAGSSSGGDVDSDWIGVGSNGSGISAGGPDSRTSGQDMTDGFSDPNAAPVLKDKSIEAGHGVPHDGRMVMPADMKLKGSTVNHDGGDVTTTGSGEGTGSVSSLDNGDDAEAGEISLGEASGIDN